jgi:hypothetical protein
MAWVSWLPLIRSARSKPWPASAFIRNRLLICWRRPQDAAALLPSRARYRHHRGQCPGCPVALRNGGEGQDPGGGDLLDEDSRRMEKAAAQVQNAAFADGMRVFPLLRRRLRDPGGRRAWPSNEAWKPPPLSSPEAEPSPLGRQYETCSCRDRRSTGDSVHASRCRAPFRDVPDPGRPTGRVNPSKVLHGVDEPRRRGGAYAVLAGAMTPRIVGTSAWRRG